MKANDEDIIFEFNKEDYFKFCQHLNIIILKDHKVFWKMGFMCKPYDFGYEIYVADIVDKATRLCSVDGREANIDVIRSTVGKLLIYYHYEDNKLQILEIDIKQFIEG